MKERKEKLKKLQQKRVKLRKESQKIFIHNLKLSKNIK
jgi:hypothetical protein